MHGRPPVIPDLKFSLDLGTVISPLLLLALAWIVNTARKAVDKRVDERHSETSQHLNRIEVLATATNGRVTNVEDTVRADHDLLFTLKGNVETLMGKT